jgi:hypothetical protein
MRRQMKEGAADSVTNLALDISRRQFWHLFPASFHPPFDSIVTFPTNPIFLIWLLSIDIVHAVL